MEKTDLWAVIEKVIIADDKMPPASVALKKFREQEVLMPLIVHSHKRMSEMSFSRKYSITFFGSFFLYIA